MQNDTNTGPNVPQQVIPPSPVPKPSKVGIVAVGIAVVLFFVGLFLYVSTSEEMNLDIPRDQTARQNTSGSQRADRVAGQLIVRFKDNVSDQEISTHLEPLNASIKSRITGVNSIVISVPAGKEEEVIKTLAHDPIVKFVEPDYIYYLQAVPADPFFGMQWGLMNSGQDVDDEIGTPDADIDAEQAWDVTRGVGIKVAILDSGIDINHPEFANKIIATKAFASSNALDTIGHGTHVAGIIAARANNGQGITGVCPECQLVIGKITTDDNSGAVPTSVIAPSILWASENDVQVINMSISGSSFSQTVQDAVNVAWNNNAVLVAAAGNEGGNTKKYPAGYANVISVANTDSRDEISPTSNFGTWVSVAAPGSSIFSTYPTTPNVRNITNYGFSSGTSMAGPFVSGTAALVWATLFGTDNAAVVHRILDTAEKIPGTGTKWAFGRINAAKAVGAGATPSVATPTPVPPTPTPTQAPTITVAPTLIATAVTPTAAPTAFEPEPEITIIPTFFCGGSLSSICPTVPPAYPVQTQAPINPTPTAATGTTYPTAGASVPTIETPSIPGYGNGSDKPGRRLGHHKKAQGGVAQFVKMLLKLFLALIQQILAIFGNR